MTYRLLGALLIITGCGGFGMTMVINEKHQERMLKGLLEALQHMQWELQYRLTPLPELLNHAASRTGGEIGDLLRAVSAELQQQVLPDVNSCVQKILQEQKDQPRPARSLLRKLGVSLGNYDLPGQLAGLSAAEDECRMELQKLEEGKSQRYRSYETLGLCTGAALAILFI